MLILVNYPKKSVSIQNKSSKIIVGRFRSQAGGIDGGEPMTESTMRAERPEPQSSAALSFNWAVPQKPVSVRMPFALIDRLEHDAVESFRSLSSRGSEIGGLLLGYVSPGSPAAVSIEDYELIECDYSRGPLYRLSDAGMGLLERAIEQRRVSGGLVVAGFFRSHTRK